MARSTTPRVAESRVGIHPPGCAPIVCSLPCRECSASAGAPDAARSVRRIRGKTVGIWFGGVAFLRRALRDDDMRALPRRVAVSVCMFDSVTIPLLS